MPQSDNKLQLVIQALRTTAEKLERWADESMTGGWSTHQVRPMREEAERIYAIIGRSLLP